jgi:hypothetical protein
MQSSAQGFEQIMSAVLEQKQAWELLQADNRELRQQLADLRAGRGIFLEILGQRFALASELVNDLAEQVTMAQPLQQSKRASKSARAVAAQLTQIMPQSGVLEEMLLDELSMAMKKQRPVAKAPLNEAQKAELRRDLAGSFLLE